MNFWVILAICLILIGAIVFVGVMTKLNWNFEKLSTVKYVTNTYEISNAVTDVLIDADCGDVDVVYAKDGFCKVVCREEENLRYGVSVCDGKLTIELTDNRAWYQHLKIGFGSTAVTVYLPENKYSSFTARTSAGDIQIPQAFTFGELDVTATTGNIDLRANVTGTAACKVTTGNIRVENVSAGDLQLSASTGHIDGEAVICAREMAVRISTGNIRLAGVQCGIFQATGKTGDAKLTEVIASGKMQVELTTGDVELERCNAGELFLKTSTGDIEGSLLTEKVFHATTRTGSVEVPKTVTGGICEVITATGNIKLTIG